MASSRLLDRGQKIEWTDGTLQTHVLAVPLQDVTPGDGTPLWRHSSLNGRVFESITVGNPLNDRFVLIRYEDEFSSFISMLRAGINDSRQLTYTEDATTDNFHIVEPNSINQPQLEDDFQQFGEIRYRLRIRKTDGSTWNTL